MPRQRKITLSERYLQGGYCTDKYQLGYYDHFYEKHLKPYTKNPINMLEIGIRGGGSIKIWREYFHQDSNIYGGDITPFNKIENANCYQIDMYSQEALNLFEESYFDIVIDDGPHTYESFEKVISLYFSKIKPNGILIIEDIIDEKFIEPLFKLAEEIGYSKCEFFNMSGKQKYDDLLEKWKNGLYILKIEK